ncbi:PepSY-associated TM helix domain-containing protein [Haliangium sp.]|uniref:PepSY-associated TM helix domain-containing protein n=1 Tax=Haliangium sp. TaxID=2663208 RepID=UPI003D0DD529
MDERRGLLARAKKRWRAWLRVLHRDAGYLAVGLTFIYAVSGIAINHLEDWNPNFETVSRTHQLDGAVPADEQAATAYVLDQLGIDLTPREAYLVTDTQLEIYFDNRSLVVDTDTGRVFDEAQEPRFFLRVANWLHYNRGKAAWTYIADAYALFLLFLAVSGMFMLRGRNGLLGRGLVLVLAGVSVPIFYVTLAAGPGG